MGCQERLPEMTLAKGVTEGFSEAVACERRREEEAAVRTREEAGGVRPPRRLGAGARGRRGRDAGQGEEWTAPSLPWKVQRSLFSSQKSDSEREKRSTCKTMEPMCLPRVLSVRPLGSQRSSLLGPHTSFRLQSSPPMLRALQGPHCHPDSPMGQGQGLPDPEGTERNPAGKSGSAQMCCCPHRAHTLWPGT